MWAPWEKDTQSFSLFEIKKKKRKCSSDKGIESVCEQRIKYDYGEKKKKKCRFSS